MKSKILKISIIVLFISFFILLNWNSFQAPFERDEGEYAYSAWLLRTGGTPYQDSFLQKPPLIIYTYLAGQMISPFAVWPPRMLASIFIFITAILIYLIAKKEWGEIAGIFSAFLFLPMIGFPVLTPFTANTEKFMILPMIGILALFVYFKNSLKSWPYILAGILSSIAIFYKPICLPVIIFIIIFYLFKLYKSYKNPKISLLIKPFLLLGSSMILTSIIILLPFLKVWSFFIEEVFIYNSSYINTFNNPYLFNFLDKFIHYWWILLLLLFGLIFEKPKNILYYFTLLIFSLLAVLSSTISHYYLIIIPFLTLLCGALFNSLLESLSLNDKQKKITTIVILPIILFIILFPFKIQFSLSPQKLSEWVYGTANPFGESMEVARHLAEVTNKDDSVFIAGSEPQIYYYAQRKSPNRFIITFPLNLPTQYREQYQTELVNNLENTKPNAIIISKRSDSGLYREGSPEIFIKYLNEIILKNYHTIGGYVWYDNDNGHWQDILDEDQTQRASLLLLIKNK
ncbi:hypothetical protein CO033_01130 [Candidatus Nomurabacteria bacterium CG_4_9_14_0_2_um_filter_32_10]|uniref:Glycosyltransferase RgtA/B/C/D-like domain-containing protein n=1 Tax=Candidatus Nomurabacteria bacterium CG_4_9_14_0_2_um_filter_32_10 TaxID=1974729 RepID=A0A2J0NA96_9BACT|nr:MAG: hypothetical protein CO033_01130 [Candidatus Nomurabacteria bacterium CG_4_9_14_0_2_um_filter_32_10]